MIIESLITYEEIFQRKLDISKQALLYKLLKTLNRNDTIFWCCKINYFLFKSGKSKQNQILGLISPSKENSDKITQLLEKNKHVFNKTQSFSLLEKSAVHAQDLEDDGNTFVNSPTLRDNFLGALILAGEIYAEEVYKDCEEDNLDQSFRLIFRKSVEINHTSKFENNSFVLGTKLFKEYLPVHIPKFSELVQSTYGITPEELYAAMLFIYFNIIAPDKDSLQIPNTKIISSRQEIIEKIIKLKSQTADEISEKSQNSKFDLNSIRSKPLFITQDGRLTIIDPILFLEAFEVGMLFDINNKNLLAFRQLCSSFGDAFENFIVDSLKSKFNSTILSKRFWDEKLIESDFNWKYPLKKKIDGYIDYGHKGILIEIKAKFIQDLGLPDFEGYEKELDSKIGEGIIQLVHFINKIIQNNDIPIFEALKKVYPLLIVRDINLSSPLTIKYFSDKFKNMLECDEVLVNTLMIKSNLVIYPLIIMTIDEFQILIGNNLDWTKFLDEYHKFDSERKSNLNNFLASCSKKKGIIHNARNAQEMMKELQVALKLFSIENNS